MTSLWLPCRDRHCRLHRLLANLARLARLESYIHLRGAVRSDQRSERQARRCPSLPGPTVTRGGAIRSLIGLTTRGLQVQILLALPIFVWQAQE
jgi:hypothetical protein